VLKKDLFNHTNNKKMTVKKKNRPMATKRKRKKNAWEQYNKERKGVTHVWPLSAPTSQRLSLALFLVIAKVPLHDADSVSLIG
jgi:hypothetical protein